jgi:predicted MFS family arabinose efflux permease
LIYPLVQGRELGWPVWSFLCMGASVPLLVLFAQHQRHRSGRRPTLIETSLFTKRAYSGGLVVALAFFTGMTGMLLVFNLYLQLGLHYSALRAGLALLPWSLGIAVGAGAAGAALAPRFGRRVLHAGLVVMIVGLLSLIWTVHFGGTTVWQFAPSTLVMGIGMGLILAPLFDIVLAGVDQSEVGSASGVLTAIQQLGGSLGAAALGTAFFDRLGGGGFGHALSVAGFISVGALLASFGLAFLLPRHARTDG